MANFKTVGRRLLSLVVILGLLQTTTSSLALSQTAGRSASSSLASQDRPDWISEKLNRFMVELAKNQPGSATPLTGDESNLFGLRSQVIVVPEGAESHTYRLGESMLPLPNPGVSDLGVQTTMTLENGDFVITHNKRKLQQRISGFKFQSMKTDGQFVFLLSENGDIHSMSARVIRKMLFQGPIPVFQVGKFSGPMTGETRIDIVSEKDGPAKLSDVLQKELQSEDGRAIAFSKGDVFIRNGGETVDILSRADLSNVYLATSKFLALLCFQNDPQYFSSDKEIREILDADNANLSELQKLMANPEVQKAIQEPGTARTLTSIPPSILKELLSYLQTVTDHLNRGPQRKRMLMSSYLNDLTADVKEAIAEQEPTTRTNRIRAHLREVSARVETDFKAAVGKAADKVMATVNVQNLQRVAIGLTILAGVDQATGHVGSQAALSFAAQFWHTTLAPWSTPGQGRRTSIGVGVLLLAPFLYEATGYLGGLVAGKNHKDILNKISFQVYSTMNSYIEVATSMIRWSNFIPTLRRGVNPLTHPKSMNLPTASLQKRAKNRFALEDQIYNEKRLDAVAYALAHATLYDHDQVNPIVAAETEVELATNRGQIEGVMARRASQADSAEKTKELSQLAIAIRQSLKDLADPELIAELRSLPPERMEEYLEKAAELHTKLQESPLLSKSLRSFGQRVMVLWERQAPRGAGIFASESTRILRNAEANPSLADQNLRVFYNAFTSELLVSSVHGHYADISKPDDLLANGKGPFGLNPSVFAQQMQSVIFLSLANPAKMFLDFELRKDVGNQNPTPDQLIYPREEAKANVFQTAKEYVKSSTNLVKMNMGYYALRHLGMSWLYIMPAMTMAEVVRVGFLGQSPMAAFIGEISRGLGAYFAYGYLWAIETRSITLHEQETHVKAEERKDAEYRLNQGLIERNAEMTRDGTARLFAIYAREGKMPIVSAAEIDQAQRDIFEIGHEVLKNEMKNPVVPDKPNRFFLRMITIGVVLIGNKLSMDFFSAAYKSNQSLTEMMHLLGGIAMIAVPSYIALGTAQAALNKLHEKISIKRIANAEAKAKTAMGLRCEQMFAPAI